MLICEINFGNRPKGGGYGESGLSVKGVLVSVYLLRVGDDG